MYESIAVVGERGQITLPKLIRDLKGINSKDKVIVKIENKKIIIEKALNEKELKELMSEGYKKLSKINLELVDDFNCVDKEADALLNDY
jgi:AbrB family looped-hinge helix DNA binding protein